MNFNLSQTRVRRPEYAIAMQTQKTPTPQSRIGWKLVLLVPFIGLCFPQIYAKATPALFGFPFFYWYQFAWVILASAIMGLVYRKLKY
jgi:Protein of unknown function (DUF3311)